MSMKAKTRRVDSVSVVDISGRITLGEDLTELRHLIRNLLAQGQKQILLNLADVSYIDSSGIGELVSGFTAASNQGGQLKLLHLTKKVHDLLQITKLLTVFEVYDDEAAAIDSFQKATGA
ncbi:MAG TPA: STAS domain-containing protein [Terriglobia bacterium]|nr:STAS domain-containing protein [Terriglobia bacterium]